MTEEYEGRAIVATHATLKWFIIIGLTFGVTGICTYWIISPFIGSIIVLLGIILVALCTVSLLFLWLTERILPQPK
ncbi:MAG: hypothetical protein ACW98F_17490 [Candidatus Hodarchaeales archaeon]|jgi:hypothetical protein